MTGFHMKSALNEGKLETNYNLIACFYKCHRRV